MSERILKLLSQETALTTTPTTFNGAQLLRIKNSHSANSTAVVVKEDGDTTGSVSLYAGEVIYVRKKVSETIESSANDTSVRIVAVAFGD
jgi:hypothetical protein